MHLELCRTHSKGSIFYIIATDDLIYRYFFPFLPAISGEEALQWILHSIYSHQLRVLGLLPFFSTGCFLSPINLISSLPGPDPYFPSVHNPPSYLPFRTKLALVSHHLFTSSPLKLMVGQKRSQ